METMMKVYYYGGELYHHGILGQKWGVRRYQNPDGTLTDAGKKRYSKILHINEDTLSKKIELNNATDIPLKTLAKYELEDTKSTNRIAQFFFGYPAAAFGAMAAPAIAAGKVSAMAFTAAGPVPLALATLFAHKRNKDIKNLTDEQVLDLMREKSKSSEEEIRERLKLYKEWNPQHNEVYDEMLRENNKYLIERFNKEWKNAKKDEVQKSDELIEKANKLRAEGKNKEANEAALAGYITRRNAYYDYIAKNT